MVIPLLKKFTQWLSSQGKPLTNTSCGLLLETSLQASPCLHKACHLLPKMLSTSMPINPVLKTQSN